MPISNEDFDALVEEARAIVMTPAMKREQAISFAYGNLAATRNHNNVTREMVERALAQLEAEGTISFS